MECPSEQLALLEDLQALDFTVLNLKRTFDTLPQRQAILKARQTLADLRTRKEQVDGLVAKAQEKVDAVLEEDEYLTGKEKAIEEMLSGKATGFRDVEARTKELSGYAKRRETLHHQLGGYEADLNKKKEAQAKIDAALAQVEATEAREVASFKEQGTDLQKRIAATRAEREALAPSIDPELLATYEKAAARCGGVGLAHLNGKSCSVCRGVIDEARVHQCRHEAPLSTCPLCRRLLIVEK